MKKSILLRYEGKPDCFGEIELTFPNIDSLPNFTSSFILSKPEPTSDSMILDIKNEPEEELINKLDRLKKKQKAQIESIEEDLSRIKAFLAGLSTQSTELMKIIRAFSASKDSTALEKIKKVIAEKKSLSFEDLPEEVSSFNSHLWGVHEGYMAAYSRTLLANDQLLEELNRSCSKQAKIGPDTKVADCPFFQRMTYIVDLLRKFVSLNKDSPLLKQVLGACLDGFGLSDKEKSGFFENIKLLK